MNSVAPRKCFGLLSPGLRVLMGVLLVGGAQAAWAHQDPTACSGVGVGITILPFRADGTTPLGSGTVSNCEALVFKTFVSYQGGGTCAFESGTFTLTTPDNVPHVISSNVPCVGGTTNDPNSTTLNGGRGLCAGAPTQFPPNPLPSFSYTVRDQDIVDAFCEGGAEPPLTPCSKTAHCTMGGMCVGEVDVNATYANFFNHTGVSDSRGGTATDLLPVRVVICPESATGCEVTGCDPTTFQCFDNHDTCPVASTGCEQAGCDPTKTFPGCFHTTVTCSNPTCQQCDASTGLCGPITPTPPRCVGHRHDPRRRRPG